MMTNDLPMPMEDIFTLAEHLARRHTPQGERPCDVPAYSDALWGAVQAIEEYNQTPPEERTNGKGLVWKCMQNRITDAGRKTQRFNRSFGVPLNDEIIGEEDEEAAIERREFLDSIIGAYRWDEEDMKRWEWVVDVYANGLTFREVAEREGLATSVVKSKCYRLLLKLREVAGRKAG